MTFPDRATLAEITLVIAGLLLFVALFARTYEEVATPIALTLDPQSEGVEESWSGIYVGDQKIGYTLHREAPTEDGGRVLQERTQMRLLLLGAPNDMTLASDIRLDATGRVDTLLAQVKTEVQGMPVTLRAEGRTRGDGMELQLFQGGSKLTTLQLDEVPATPTTLYPSLFSAERAVGDRVSLPFFSPMSLGRSEAVVEFLGREPAFLPDGTEVSAWRVKMEANGQQIEAVVTESGRRLQEQEVDGGLGMRVLAETQEAALNEGWPADASDAVDLIALSSIPISEPLPGGGRGLSRLVLKVDGPDTVDALLVRFHGENWDPETRHLTIEVPSIPEQSYPLPSNDRALRPWLRSTTFAPSDNPRIRRQAGKVVGDELMAHDAARRLNSWVYKWVAKVPVAGVPSALEVLDSQRGDCNEHTTLYTALARSLGLPTKMAAGIVYSESIFEDGAFYYHAWPEVWLGDRWVPVDPTFGQAPADATHLKLVEGELDKQMELMGVIGRLSLTVVESEVGL